MGKTIIVTGASSGIGANVAQLFLAQGWNVGLLARRGDELAREADNHPNAHTVVCDITKENQVIGGFNEVADRFSGIDVLFNNAGIFTPQARIDQISLDDWQRSVDVNLTGMFLCAREAFRHMTANGGRIINNGSISAQTPR